MFDTLFFVKYKNRNQIHYDIICLIKINKRDSSWKTIENKNNDDNIYMYRKTRASTMLLYYAWFLLVDIYFSLL